MAWQWKPAIKRSGSYICCRLTVGLASYLSERNKLLPRWECHRCHHAWADELHVITYSVSFGARPWREISHQVYNTVTNCTSKHSFRDFWPEIFGASSLTENCQLEASHSGLFNFILWGVLCFYNILNFLWEISIPYQEPLTLRVFCYS